jgi:gliotoxin/aspirochlorine biosynthesis thioredoxin reductase
MFSFHCLFCHGYEERDVKSIGVLAVDLMAQIPQFANGLARNALRFSDDVTVYTHGSDSVAATMTSLLSTLEGSGVKIDARPIARLIKENTAAEVTIEFKDRSRVTHGFLVHGPRNEMPLDFAKDLKLEKTPSSGELKVVSPFNETTEPGCFAVGDIGSIGKIVVAGVAFGTFAATGIVKQLQGY